MMLSKPQSRHVNPACERSLALSLVLLSFTVSRGQVDPTNPISVLGGSEKDRDLSDRWYLWTVVAIVAAFFIVALFFVWRGFRNYRRYKRALETLEDDQGALEPYGGGAVNSSDPPAGFSHPTVRIEGPSLLRNRGPTKGGVELAPMPPPPADVLHVGHAEAAQRAAHPSRIGPALQPGGSGDPICSPLGEPGRTAHPPEEPSAQELLRSVHATRAEVQSMRSHLHADLRTMGPPLAVSAPGALPPCSTAQQYSRQQQQQSMSCVQYPLQPHHEIPTGGRAPAHSPAQPQAQKASPWASPFGAAGVPLEAAAARGERGVGTPRHVHWPHQTAGSHHEEAAVVDQRPGGGGQGQGWNGAWSMRCQEGSMPRLQRSRSAGQLPVVLIAQDAPATAAVNNTKELLRRMGLKRLPQPLPRSTEGTQWLTAH